MIVFCQNCDTEPFELHAQAQEGFEHTMYRPFCSSCLEARNGDE